MIHKKNKKDDIGVNKTPEWLTELRAKYQQLKQERSSLEEEMLNPVKKLKGSLSVQYRRCSNPNCRCRDSKGPQKHGPYNYLFYRKNGKGHLAYLKDEESVNMVKRYQEYSQRTLRLNEISTEIETIIKTIGEKTTNDWKKR